jgi:hypothetical protein
MPSRTPLIALLWLSAAIPFPVVAHGQNRAALQQHYGDAVGEVYRTSNGLTVTAYFDPQGNICQEHIQSENRGKRMTDNEVNGVLDDIAPKTSRGAYKIGTFLNVICLPDNDCAGVSEDYQKLAIVKIGDSNEYRYVDVLYHSAACHESGGKGDPRTP